MTRTRVFFAALLIGTLVFATPGKAQFRVIPQVGMYAPISDLGTVDTPDEVWTVGEHEAALALGLALDFASDNTVGFRVAGF